MYSSIHSEFVDFSLVGEVDEDAEELEFEFAFEFLLLYSDVASLQNSIHRRVRVSRLVLDTLDEDAEDDVEVKSEAASFGFLTGSGK